MTAPLNIPAASPVRQAIEALAQACGVTRQTIIALEAGRYAPSLELAFRIARAFGVGVEDVFQWKETE